MDFVRGGRMAQGDEFRSLAELFARLSREAEPHRPVDRALRALDLVIAGLGIVLLSPLFLIVAVTLLVTSGWPILYRGERVGLHGRVFTILKFRTLAPDAESRLAGLYGPELTRLTEAETTTVGRGLRASQLDELPQLWCVLVGDMSLVGPRPIRPTFFAAPGARDPPSTGSAWSCSPGSPASRRCG